MAAPTLLYCVGATKAGTTWLYRYLHDHPECAMPAVKEAHYWDTFDTERCEKQLVAFRTRLREMRAAKVQANAEGRGWQVANMDRRINEMKALIATLEGDRAGDSAYAAWLLNGRDAAKVVADITPNYATLCRMTSLRACGISHPQPNFST